MSIGTRRTERASAADSSQDPGPDGLIVETNIPARLDRLPWGRFHTLVVVALGITWIFDGLEVTLAGALSWLDRPCHQRQLLDRRGDRRRRLGRAAQSGAIQSGRHSPGHGLTTSIFCKGTIPDGRTVFCFVTPGPYLDGKSLYELFEAEGVTYSLGVPTVWLGFEAYLSASGARCSTLRRLLSGGSAVPPSMVEAFARHGIDLRQGWGMTEMSPLGTTAALKAKHLRLDSSAQTAVKLKQGRPVFGVQLKIVDDAGRVQPHDGKSVGELLVRGPWIVSGYFEDAEATAAAVDQDGWFHTGDVVTIDPDGYMQITDRRKDVIKSGGEWISSIALENAAVGHDDVAEAAVIAVPHPRWSERPLLIVTPRPGCQPQPDGLIAFLARQFPRWMLPDDVVVVSELPHTATGKLMKTRLREMFRDHKLPER